MAIAKVLADTSLPATERSEHAEQYAAEAVRLLHRAVESGFTDADQYRTDPDLNGLRERADFKEVIAKLPLE